MRVAPSVQRYFIERLNDESLFSTRPTNVSAQFWFALSPVERAARFNTCKPRSGDGNHPTADHHQQLGFFRRSLAGAALWGAAVLVLAREQQVIEKRLKALGVDDIQWVQFQFGPPMLQALGAGGRHTADLHASCGLSTGVRGAHAIRRACRAGATRFAYQDPGRTQEHPTCYGTDQDSSDGNTVYCDHVTMDTIKARSRQHPACSCGMVLQHQQEKRT